jgi:hypothetical protein
VNKSSESYKVYDQVAKPSQGARAMAGKPESTTDALGKPGSMKKQTEFEAKEDKGAARTAVNKQIGETAIPVTMPNKHITEQEV